MFSHFAIHSWCTQRMRWITCIFDCSHTSFFGCFLQVLERKVWRWIWISHLMAPPNLLEDLHPLCTFDMCQDRRGRTLKCLPISVKYESKTTRTRKKMRCEWSGKKAQSVYFFPPSYIHLLSLTSVPLCNKDWIFFWFWFLFFVFCFLFGFFGTQNSMLSNPGCLAEFSFSKVQCSGLCSCNVTRVQIKRVVIFFFFNTLKGSAQSLCVKTILHVLKAL